MSPFQIEGPAVISFSGGRTSGYLLRRVLDEGLQPDVHVCFADTGREFEETYRFVEEVGARWGVRVNWLTYGEAPALGRTPHAEGSSPFDRLITKKNYLPNPRQRFCTEYLKVRPIRDFMRGLGYTHWDNVLGIRADEPRRVADLTERHERKPPPWDLSFPLYQAGVTKADVLAFWAGQLFDLALGPTDSNCTLCFMKGAKTRQRLMRQDPSLARVWIADEARIGATYRPHSPSYAALLRQVESQPEFDFGGSGDDELFDCLCTD